MDFILILGVLSLCMTVTQGATRVNARIRARSTMEDWRQSKMERRRDVEEEEMHIGRLFKLTTDESLAVVNEASDSIGLKVEKLEEKYNGVSVYDTSVTVRKRPDGKLTGDATGTLIQDIDKDISDMTPKLTDDETVAIVMEAEGDTVDMVTDLKVERKIFIDKDDKAHLANKITYLIDGYKRPFYIIDANDGTILKHWQGLMTYPCCDKGTYTGIGGNVKMGVINYGDMPHCLSPSIVDGICYLENDYVRVVDMHHEYNDSLVDTASFECALGYNDSVNGGYSPALDAFMYGTVVGKMFEEWFGTTALNDKIVLRVHYGYLFENAYWNGENTTFGDGGYSMYPLTSLDIVGHEIGHGVIEQNSGLEYYDEQGGVNEAFADIFGEAAEEYLLRSDFITGQTVMKTEPYLREFAEPRNDNVSIGHASEMEDSTDPHYSSGVYRRVWYVVVKEQGMSIRDAAHVFLHANRLYWHNSASFYDVSCGLLQAAIDLGHDTGPFRVAFSDVGIEECDVHEHVFALNNNETQINVTISDSIHPTFRFQAPSWADTLLVTVDSYGGPDVKISVMKKGWEVSDDPCKEVDAGEILEVGINELRVSDAAHGEFYIYLEPGPDVVIGDFNETLPVVHKFQADVTVGYTCLSDWSGDYLQSYFYRELCGIAESYW